jgi:hypothetical protein
MDFVRVPMRTTVERNALYGDQSGSFGRENRVDDPWATDDTFPPSFGESPAERTASDLHPVTDIKVAGAAAATRAFRSRSAFDEPSEDGGPEVRIRKPASEYGRRARRSRSRKSLKIALVGLGVLVVVGGAIGVASAASGGGSKNGTDALGTNGTSHTPAPLTPAELAQRSAQARQQLVSAAEAAAQQDGQLPLSFGKKGSKPKPTPTSTTTGTSTPPMEGDPVPASTAQAIAKQLLPSYGFSPSTQFGCLVDLWNRESGWNVHAYNSATGAGGIPQADPMSKMASAGPDYENNATTQIKWGLSYIKERWSTPCGAWSNEESAGWY